MRARSAVAFRVHRECRHGMLQRMSVFQALLLGILQGATEFIPVSSSGHLVLAQSYLGLTIAPQDLQGFDILLHAATALALLMIFWRRWWALMLSPLRCDTKNRHLLIAIIVASVPAGIAGMFLEDLVSEQLRSVQTVAAAMLVTAFILLLTRCARGNRTVHQTGIARFLLVGCAQAVAIVPGISRSGCTIAMGQFVGMHRSEALDFSFLLAVPIIIGALTLTVFHAWQDTLILPQPMVALTGFIASFVSSIFAIIFLRSFVARHSLAWFAVYLIPLAVLLLV